MNFFNFFFQVFILVNRLMFVPVNAPSMDFTNLTTPLYTIDTFASLQMVSTRYSRLMPIVKHRILKFSRFSDV